jgi:hypothetical protein
MRARITAPLLLALACSKSAPTAPAPYEKRTLDTAYRAEGVGVFDVDQDGHADVVTDQFWYAGPSFTPHEIRTPETYDPGTSLGNGFAVYPQDVDGDGWTDIVVAPQPTHEMLWYANPRGQGTHWTPHTIAPAGVAGLETPIFVDLFADGHPVLVMSDTQQGVLGWFTPGPDVTAPWVLHPITGPGFPGAVAYAHGVGAGDVDGDGRLDVLTPHGWYQQTADRDVWTPHVVSFGTDECSRMFAFDADGDGLADVFCAHPHVYGFHWFQQARASGSAEPAFVDHDIDESLSQMHALRLDDLDGDGVPELVSVKRWWARGDKGDPGLNDPALLVYYALRRGDGGASFERHVVDDDSGVGAQFAIADLNADGKVDIVTSNKKGLFVFLRR